MADPSERVCQSQCGTCYVDGASPEGADTEGQIKICIIGSGNWGTTLAKIVAQNAKRNPKFSSTVKMFVNEEEIDGRKLTDIINQDHENVKYLPGCSLPPNLVAVPDVIEVVTDADAIIFVLPHQFVQVVCETITGKLKPNACVVSLIKGFGEKESGGILLISSVIKDILGIEVSVLMGANLASEIANGFFAEATLGCDDDELSELWLDILGSDDYSVCSVRDKISVEIFSGLKNVIAVGAGIIDGLELGKNCKAALMRQGVVESLNFIDTFYTGTHFTTFFESCGLADIITTCEGGRNREVGEMFVKTGKDMATLAKEHYPGQVLEGPSTAAGFHTMLQSENLESKFPVLSAIHLICSGEIKPIEIVDAMRSNKGIKLTLKHITL